jgi:hypothetical protein
MISCPFSFIRRPHTDLHRDKSKSGFLQQSQTLTFEEEPHLTAIPRFLAFASISLMPGGDFSSLCPVSERIQGFLFNDLKALFI